MAEKKKKSASKLFMILLILVLTAGPAGFYLYKKGIFGKGSTDVHQFNNISTRTEVISFAEKQVPDAYTALLNLDEETGVIKKEIEHLDQMAKTYPQQTKIISEEKKIWEKTQKENATVLSKLENEVEAIYVSYMVNPEKGMKRIEDKKTSDLLVEVDKVITSSREQTARLKVVVHKNIIEKIKDKLFNSS